MPEYPKDHSHMVVRKAACEAPGTGLLHGEPKLQEILLDPIVLALIRRDGLTVDDVVQARRRARRALAGAAGRD